MAHDSSNKNPIFIEWYSHENCECYKIKNPWTQYGGETYVLCPVSEGIEYARIVAIGVIMQQLTDALKCEIIDSK